MVTCSTTQQSLQSLWRASPKHLRLRWLLRLVFVGQRRLLGLVWSYGDKQSFIKYEIQCMIYFAHCRVSKAS